MKELNLRLDLKDLEETMIFIIDDSRVHGKVTNTGYFYATIELSSTHSTMEHEVVVFIYNKQCPSKRTEYRMDNSSLEMTIQPHTTFIHEQEKAFTYNGSNYRMVELSPNGGTIEIDSNMDSCAKFCESQRYHRNSDIIGIKEKEESYYIHKINDSFVI